MPPEFDFPANRPTNEVGRSLAAQSETKSIQYSINRDHSRLRVELDPELARNQLSSEESIHVSIADRFALSR